MQRVRAGTASRRAHTRCELLLAALVTLLALSIPTSALAGPAVDEYTLDFPDAKGKVESPGAAPASDAGALPPRVVERLKSAPHGSALQAIATSGELGAPSPPAKGRHSALPDVSGDQPSALGAASGSIADTAVLGLILVPAAAIGALYLMRTKRSGR